MNISVFLADDHRIVRDGLRKLFEARADMRVVGESGEGRETVGEVGRLKPDVVLMDIAMPGLNGIEAAREIRRRFPRVEVVILSMHSTTEHVYRALEAGARGYVLKECAGSEVIAAVRAAKAGRRFLSLKIPESEIEAYLERRAAGRTASPLDRLSAREREIRLGAEDYADGVLGSLETNLEKFIAAVQRGRERLQGREEQDELQP